MREIDKELYDILSGRSIEYNKAKALLDQGADINAKDDGGDTMISKCIFACLDHRRERCWECNDEHCSTCDAKTAPDVLPLVEFFIENGWDTFSQGFDALAAINYMYDEQMFYAARRILECSLPENEEAYEEILDAFGTEESYQRCCCEDHSQENLYYAMVELIDAKKNGRDFKGIHPYYKAIGKKVDKIVYFSDKVDFNKTNRGTEYNADIGFICGNEVVVVSSDVNILLMNDRIDEAPQIEVPSYFGDGVVGSIITDISFAHKTKCKGSTCYGQSIIIIRFDNEKELRFTHNFGEQTNKYTQSRFLSTDLNALIAQRSNELYSLCAVHNVDVDKVEKYIIENGVSSDEITGTAIRLIDKFMFEIDSFKYDNNRVPEQNELVTSSWISLFDMFLRHGLETDATYCKDGINHSNVLDYLTFIDNTETLYGLMRFLLNCGADPNIIIDDESFFSKVDGSVVLNATLLEIEGEDRQIFEKEFRLWLLLIAHGGRLKTNGKVIDMREGHTVDIFDDCERFSYRKEITADDWYLHVYITDTGEEVAVL